MMRSVSTGHYKPKKNSSAIIAANLAVTPVSGASKKRALTEATEVYEDGTTAIERDSANSSPESESSVTVAAKRSRSQPSYATSADSMSELSEAFSTLRL